MRDRDQMALDAVAGRRPNGKGKIRANCPWCELIVSKVDKKQCFELDITTGWWKCYRCDTRGKLEELPHDVSTMAPSLVDKPPPPQVQFPQGFVPMWKDEGKTSFACRHARKYLEHRGISEATIAQARIGACITGLFQSRVIVPIYTSGRLVGYVGRSWKKGVQPKYRYNEGFERATTLYNEECLYITTDEPCIIVEGTFDTFPFFPNAAAVLGKPSGAQIEMLLNARRPIAIAMDGDAWREGEALAMSLRMAGKRAVSLKLPPTYDPDEMPKQITEAARAAFAA